MMKHFVAFAVMAVVFSASSSLAQSQQPYAGLHSRSIKALSDEQLADLRAGRGMSLALPAELNGYPGPLHVIELADALALRPDQRVRVQQFFERMRDEAVAIGGRLIAQEAELDRLFATRSVTAPTLSETTMAIGQTQAELRAAHLRYHLLTADILTPDQMGRYGELRGYSGTDQGQRHHPKLHR
jgi:hypothetical protein